MIFLIYPNTGWKWILWLFDKTYTYQFNLFMGNYVLQISDSDVRNCPFDVKENYTNLVCYILVGCALVWKVCLSTGGCLHPSSLGRAELLGPPYRNYYLLFL